VFDYSDRDRATIAAGVEIQNELARALALDPAAARRSEHYRFHPAGTCRMGFAESDGVVDRDLAVFGMDNLYVAGAAVFPGSGTANPTATVVALTLRLADRLIDRLRSGDLPETARPVAL
jgi:choline dehydrogenase-like flavoprotein